MKRITSVIKKVTVTLDSGESVILEKYELPRNIAKHISTVVDYRINANYTRETEDHSATSIEITMAEFLKNIKVVIKPTLSQMAEHEKRLVNTEENIAVFQRLKQSWRDQIPLPVLILPRDHRTRIMVNPKVLTRCTYRIADVFEVYSTISSRKRKIRLTGVTVTPELSIL